MRYREIVLAAAIVSAIGWVGLFGSSFMEARAFNRITGSDVTTWEAVWVNLRVDRPVTRGVD